MRKNINEVQNMYRLLKLSLMTSFICLLAASVLHAESIYEIQYTTQQGSGDDCYPSDYYGDEVTISGVVTGVNQGNYPNFFLQNPDSTTWNGVYIYDESVDPAIGDSVTITCEVDEYYGWTEIKNLSSHNIISSGKTFDTLLITTADLAGGCGLDQEKYESIIVKVEGATVTGDAGYGSHWIYDGSGDSCKIDDEMYRWGDDTPEIEIGLTYDIVGLVWYNYDEYKINPRFAADVVAVGGAPSVKFSFPLDRTHLLVTFNMNVDSGTGLDTDNYNFSDGLEATDAEFYDGDHSKVRLTTTQQDNGHEYTLTCEDIESEGGTPMPEPDVSTFYGGFTGIATVQQPISSENDSSQLAGEYVTVKAVVTADTADHISYYFFVQDESYSTFNGIKIYNSNDANPQRGDTLVIAGLVQEYFNETEIGDIKYYEALGNGPEILPTEVGAADLTNDSPRAEWYEGVLVKIDEEMEILTEPDENGNWTIQDLDGENTVIVYHGEQFFTGIGDTIVIWGNFVYNFDEYK
ncbi:MAG: hypothetical protein GF315_11385, partial [candidate division Zixibacteria bacterium]|nr:hypothetical protein [candidate division Zixibacteria bacterium]